MNAHNEQQAASKALQRIRTIASQAGTEQQHGPQFVAGMRRAANLLEKAIAATPAAPVAAAPAGLTRDDAEQVIDRIMGEYGFSMPSRAYAELVDEFMCTPAAPGIDNTTPVDRGALQMAINVLRRAGKDEVADALIDASPKGATFPNDGNSEAEFIADGERLNCPACGGSGHVDDSPKGGIEAVAAWEDGLLDADSATLQSDCNARYEVCFVISESHNGIWRAGFNPDTEAPYNGKEVPIGTFATKGEAQHACEEHAKLARGAGAVKAQAGDAEVQP